MMTNLMELGNHIQSKLIPQHRVNYYLDHGELVLHVDKIEIDKVLGALKRDPHCRFNQLMDICGVHYPSSPFPFQLVYNLLSLELNTRLRVIIEFTEEEFVPSVGSIYRSAPWYEREAWDLYGIKFSNHHDLRRILTDYGFEGHPLRKDFPLWGFTETIYDSELKRVKHQAVKLEQEYRDFVYFLRVKK